MHSHPSQAKACLGCDHDLQLFDPLGVGLDKLLLQLQRGWSWLSWLCCNFSAQASKRGALTNSSSSCRQGRARRLVTHCCGQVTCPQWCTLQLSEPTTKCVLEQPLSVSLPLTSLRPVFKSSSVMGRRHCCGMLNRSRSEGRTCGGVDRRWNGGATCSRSTAAPKVHLDSVRCMAPCTRVICSTVSPGMWRLRGAACAPPAPGGRAWCRHQQAASSALRRSQQRSHP